MTLYEEEDKPENAERFISSLNLLKILSPYAQRVQIEHRCKMLQTHVEHVCLV